MLWKLFRGLLIVILVLAAVFFIGAQFLDKRAEVSRSIAVNAPPEMIWPLISDFNRVQDWSPWSEHDPDMELTITGAPGAIGHRQTWRSDNDRVGVGSQEIIDIDPLRRVETALEFEGQSGATATLQIIPQAGGAQVEWRFEAVLDGPVMKWMGLMFDGMIGPDYERGLANLKDLAEGGV